MAIVDFTTYTEQDLSGEIAVISSRITFTTLAIDEVAYVMKDYEAGFFTGDFVHRQKVQFDESTWDEADDAGRNTIWALTDTAVHTTIDIQNSNSGHQLEMGSSAGFYFLNLRDEATDNNDFYLLDTPPFTWWLEFERSGTDLTCKVYSDNYITLIKTMSIVCTATAFRYHTAVGSSNKDGAADPDTITGYVEDFDPAPFVDFTTYTEVDENGDIAVTASKVDIVAMRNDAVSYVMKDYEAGFFTTINHRFKTHFESGTDRANVTVWGLNDEAHFTMADMWNNDTGIYIAALQISGTYYLQLVYPGVAFDSDTYTIPSVPVDLWVQIERVGTTWTAIIYSDAYITVVDTLEITAESGAMRYHIAAAANNVGNDAETTTVTSENFEIITEPTNTITVEGLRTDDADHYIYKDFGVDYFDTSWKVFFELEFGSNEPGDMACLIFTNTVGDRSDQTVKHIGIFYYGPTMYFIVKDGFQSVSDDFTPDRSTRYYLEMERVDTTGDFSEGRNTLKIRTGSHTGTLIDTLLLDSREKLDWRYVFAIASAGGSGDKAFNMLTANYAFGPADGPYEDFNTYTEADANERFTLSGEPPAPPAPPVVSAIIKRFNIIEKVTKNMTNNVARNMG